MEAKVKLSWATKDYLVKRIRRSNISVTPFPNENPRPVGWLCPKDDRESERVSERERVCVCV